MKVRVASGDDGAVVAEIYAPIVEQTCISFESEPPSAAEMRRRIEESLPSLPWLIMEVSGTPVGFAYAAPHRQRPAYRWTAEVSVYVNESSRGRGVGRRLYEALLATLRLQRFHSACAGITLPNDASVALHESTGFSKVGIYRSVGWKFGTWHDVGWWQVIIGPDEAPVSPPIAFAATRETDSFTDLLERS